MAVTIRMFNDQTLREDPVEVPDEVLQEMATLCLTGRAFRDLIQTGTLRDLDAMRYKWKRWMQAMREAQRAPQQAAATDATAWIARARERRSAGASWRELEREFNTPVRTLRRYLTAA